MPKAVADEVKDCDKKPLRDSAGRLVGVTMGGALCPIRSQWVTRTSDSGNGSTDLSYRAQDDKFTQILPVVIMTLDGRRTTVPFGGQYKTTLTYRGSARDSSEDVVSFEVIQERFSSQPGGFFNAREMNYFIKISFRDFSAEGRIVDNESFTLNGDEITRDEFDKLFFVLK